MPRFTKEEAARWQSLSSKERVRRVIWLEMVAALVELKRKCGILTGPEELEKIKQVLTDT